MTNLTKQMARFASLGAAFATASSGCSPSVFEAFAGPDMTEINECGVPLTVLEDPSADPDLLPDPAFLPRTAPSKPRLLQQNVAKPWSSGRALKVAGDRLVIADSANGNVTIMDRNKLSVLHTVAVGGAPDQVVVGPDNKAYVTLREAGQVARIDVATGAIEQRWAVGVEPIGVAMSPSADLLFVAVAAENKLVALHTDGSLARVVTVAERPRTVAVTSIAGSDDVRIVIGHQNPVGASKIGATVFAYTPGPGALLLKDVKGQPLALRTSNPGHGAAAKFSMGGVAQNNLKAVRVSASAVDPESGDVVIAHMLAAPGTKSDTLASLSGGGSTKKASSNSYGSGGSGSSFACTSTPVRPMELTMSSIGGSTPNGKVRATRPEFAIADPTTGRSVVAAFDQPSDVNFHPTATMAFVTAMGTDNVMVVNTAAEVGDVMANPIAEIKVGQAPRAIDFSADGKTAYVLNGHDWTVSAVDLSALLSGDASDCKSGSLVHRTSYKGCESGHQKSDAAPQFAQVQQLTASADKTRKFGDDPLPETMRTGRRIFHWSANPALAKSGRFACASCHFEGAEDKQVWHIADGPRQTPALAGRLRGTEPFNWRGTEHGLQNNMDKTIVRMGGKGLSAPDLAALESFMLDGLREPPNPHRQAQLTADQEAGRKLFFDPEVGCGSCHSGSNTTDGAMHDVGTATSVELTVASVRDGTKSVKFNTPSLRGVWGTAPYLHDGSAATLRDALTRTSGKMGDTSKLSSAQLDQLVAYMRTL